METEKVKVVAWVSYLDFEGLGCPMPYLITGLPDLGVILSVRRSWPEAEVVN